MDNEELKKKIVEIIINAIWKDAEADYDSTDETEAGSIADALIEAGIGDVKEVEAKTDRYEMLYKLQNRDMALAERRIHDAEHRAALAEMALDKAVKLFYEYRIECDVLSCSSCWIADEAFKKCEAKGLYKDCLQQWKEEILIQAEKELAEERREP